MGGLWSKSCRAPSQTVPTGPGSSPRSALECPNLISSNSFAHRLGAESASQITGAECRVRQIDALIFGLAVSDPTPNLSLSHSQISLSCARCLVLPGSLVRSLPGSSGISHALVAWFPNPTVRAESRFPNPTVQAGSAGGLKRKTVASRTDRRTK